MKSGRRIVPSTTLADYAGVLSTEGEIRMCREYTRVPLYPSISRGNIGPAHVSAADRRSGGSGSAEVHQVGERARQATPA